MVSICLHWAGSQHRFTNIYFSHEGPRSNTDTRPLTSRGHVENNHSGISPRYKRKRSPSYSHERSSIVDPNDYRASKRSHSYLPPRLIYEPGCETRPGYEWALKREGERVEAIVNYEGTSEARGELARPAIPDLVTRTLKQIEKVRERLHLFINPQIPQKNMLAEH